MFIQNEFIMKALIILMLLAIVFGSWAVFQLIKEARARKKLIKWKHTYNETNNTKIGGF